MQYCSNFVNPMADGEEDTKQLQVHSTKRVKVDGQQSSMKRIMPTGAAVYKSAFQACWQKKWPYNKPVNDDPHFPLHCLLQSNFLSAPR